MADRDPALAALVAAYSEGVGAATEPPPGALSFLADATAALARPAPAASPAPRRLPACRHLEPALAQAAAGPAAAAARALAALEPRLAWATRPGAEAHGEAFAAGHANARIIGPGGLEPRDDVMLGVSLVAPEVVYPDHDHPPEELYLVLSEGAWRQEAGPFAARGPGGLVLNPPGIRHAMRAGSRPLLALWLLLRRD